MVEEGGSSLQVRGIVELSEHSSLSTGGSRVPERERRWVNE
jgi:hypothetical protein